MEVRRWAPGVVVAVLLACGSSRSGFDAADSKAQSGDGGTIESPSVAACANGKTCVGNAIHTCDAAGNAGAKVGECTGKGEVCIGGECQTGCAAAAVMTSNMGCEFWAVDLDNEKNALNDAAGAPWGIVISNAGDKAADVLVEQNAAEPGQPVVPQYTKKFSVGPGVLEVVEMPTREVDGSLLGNNEGPGTMLSSRAFRITSTQPVVVYQFNALRSQYSNDASLLLPTTSLGQTYRALSWPSGKPISVFGSPIDHAYVTVVGTKEGTSVDVTVSQAVLGGGAVPATPKGGVVHATLGPFDVLNLETDGMPGDLTGTIVTSSAPVAVFVGTELSGGSEKIPPAPPTGADNCCLDHLEEQLLPVESYGKKFAVTRSPPRGSSYIEPDYVRFMGVASPAQVKTNLPAPDDAFTLNPGQIRDIFAAEDFTVDASEPIAIGQILVSQGYTEQGIGDPSLTILSAVDQFRQDYLFLVPGSWRSNFVVIAMPEGAAVTIDGAPLAGCTGGTIGVVDGVTFVSKRCPLVEGTHTMAGDKPFGIIAYGYGNAGSYAFVGGSNVKKIYTPPPLR